MINTPSNANEADTEELEEQVWNGLEDGEHRLWVRPHSEDTWYWLKPNTRFIVNAAILCAGAGQLESLGDLLLEIEQVVPIEALVPGFADVCVCKEALGNEDNVVELLDEDEEAA